MNQRNKGILVSVLSSILYMIFAVLVGVLISLISPDPWSGLVFSIFAILFGVAVMLGIMIFAAVKYRKEQSQYALGVLYGLIGYFVVVGITFLINAALGI